MLSLHMTAKEIYENYKIMENLQFHQLQVAGVTKLICDSLKFSESDLNSQLRVALTHDMGNILKFDLARYPETTEPEGLEYWEGVKSDFREKYGEDEHEATLAIAKELGLNDFEIELINRVGFSQSIRNSKESDIKLMIVGYADARVNFGNIVSIEERFRETLERKRANLKSQGIEFDDSKYMDQLNAFKKIEEMIFKNSSIAPDNIDQESVDSEINNIKILALF